MHVDDQVRVGAEAGVELGRTTRNRDMWDVLLTMGFTILQELAGTQTQSVYSIQNKASTESVWNRNVIEGPADEGHNS